MKQDDQERISRALEEVLLKLKRPANEAAGSNSSVLFVEESAAGGVDSGSPLVLVVLGGSNSSAQGEAVPRSSAAPAGSSAQCSTTHPGLERFPLGQPDSPPAAPKACFMEPARACVNSGACEMRGF